MQSKAMVDARDRDGETPLYLAAARGNNDIVERLLLAGANANAVTKHGATALHCAVWRGNSEMVRALLAVGVDVNARSARRLDAPQVGRAG